MTDQARMDVKSDEELSKAEKYRRITARQIERDKKRAAERRADRRRVSAQPKP